MSLTPAMIDAFVAAGGTVQQLAAMMKADLAEQEAKKASKRTGNAERQRRFKSKRRHVVTHDNVDNALPSVTLSPNDIYSNPLSNSSDEELGAAAPIAAKPVKVSCPAGVSPQVWGDFYQHRKAGKAAVSATAMAGIEREAGKAGWTLEAALVEMVSRGWRGFKADWVKDQPKPSNPAANDLGADPLMRSIMAMKAREATG